MSLAKDQEDLTAHCSRYLSDFRKTSSIANRTKNRLVQPQGEGTKQFCLVDDIVLVLFRLVIVDENAWMDEWNLTSTQREKELF